MNGRLRRPPGSCTLRSWQPSASCERLRVQEQTDDVQFGAGRAAVRSRVMDEFSSRRAADAGARRTERRQGERRRAAAGPTTRAHPLLPVMGDAWAIVGSIVVLYLFLLGLNAFSPRGAGRHRDRPHARGRVAGPRLAPDRGGRIRQPAGPRAPRLLARCPSRSQSTARFNGPPDSAQGGYACGLVAERIDSPGAAVSLRAPPPLERPLEVRRGVGRLRRAARRRGAGGRGRAGRLRRRGPGARRARRCSAGRRGGLLRHQSSVPNLLGVRPASLAGRGHRRTPGPGRRPSTSSRRSGRCRRRRNRAEKRQVASPCPRVARCAGRRVQPFGLFLFVVFFAVFFVWAAD